jgi:hypothetical protein
MAYKKCDFKRMDSRIIPKRTSNKEKTRKILENRKKREKEWKTWLTG